VLALRGLGLGLAEIASLLAGRLADLNAVLYQPPLSLTADSPFS
jgi:hypothetical protein